MKSIRVMAIAVLVLTAVAILAAGRLAPAGYEHQFRETPQVAPSTHHPLGTDDLGRDRWARLLYGMRVSLTLAPLAALSTTILAGLIGGIAGYFGGWTERCCKLLIDLFLSVPWLFLLITVRAVLPLNISPEASVTVTFALLGLLGWAASARVICSGAKDLMKSEFVWMARASGFSGMKLVRLHLLPNLRGALLAQFWISIPVFIIAEANLGALGLGVAEPLPSLGSLLRELQEAVTLRPEPWRLLPLGVLIVVISSFQVLLKKQEVRV
ncbi:MAG TPA: ABC transporter permease [Candidatus Angelobacter sp.]|nr:ABC transporter permease [Candidatus Angelobacter sp.]